LPVYPHFPFPSKLCHTFTTSLYIDQFRTPNYRLGLDVESDAGDVVDGKTTSETDAKLDSTRALRGSFARKKMNRRIEVKPPVLFAGIVNTISSLLTFPDFIPLIWAYDPFRLLFALMSSSDPRISLSFMKPANLPAISETGAESVPLRISTDNGSLSAFAESLLDVIDYIQHDPALKLMQIISQERPHNLQRCPVEATTSLREHKLEFKRMLLQKEVVRLEAQLAGVLISY
jgi:hypothetical protein